VSIMSKTPTSNIEWQAWGEKDPLYGVGSRPGKRKEDAQPWTDEELYKVGASDWNCFHPRWQQYGLMYDACAEIGCGVGRITRQLARQFRRVHAVDVSPGMIEYARKNIKAECVEFHLGNGAKIPLDDKSVTAVFSCHVFQHFDNLHVGRENFREIYRVLAAGGTAMIHLPVYSWPRPEWAYNAFKWVYSAMASWKLGINRLLLRAGIFRPVMRTLFYPTDWIFRELAAIGFERVEIVWVGPGVPFVFAAKRIRPEVH